LRDRNLSRAARRELRAKQREELNELRASQREDRQKARARIDDNQRDQARQDRRERRVEQREFRRKERAAQREQRLRERRQARADAGRDLRRDLRRVDRTQARQGRFAAPFNDPGARDARRASRLVAARTAWRHGHHAHFVAWVGPVFWPYAYTDIFYYTFWPYAYDEGYWAYAYDDFFTAVFFAYPPDYYEDIYAGPYPAPATTGTARAIEPSRQVRRAVEQVCEPAEGVTAWPFADIEKRIDLHDGQRALLDELKDAAAEAADAFRTACDPKFALTPPGRLQGMISRLEATLEAVGIVRPPLEKFYEALDDEQKARFNALGPKVGRDEAQSAQKEDKAMPLRANCGGEKEGLTALPMNRLEEVLKPTAAQREKFDRLHDATGIAVETLQSACPDTIALTPVARLEATQNRLTAMLDAAETVLPPLQDFYAALSSEQKARFNRLGRETARNE